MTADRTEEGVRVRIKRTGQTGTALYGPYSRYDLNWPGFSRGDQRWLVPVRWDEDGSVCLYAPSELEPGPRRPWPKLGSRQVKHRDREGTGTLLETLTASGVTWPGLDRAGNLMVPVELDNGQYRIWRATDIERAPEPEPALVPGEPPYGPRVRVRDATPGRDRGRVLYRAMASGSGRVWPGFDHNTKWRVPVRMEATGATLFVLATDLEPYTDARLASMLRSVEFDTEEATILAEADKLANTIQAKALRDVAKAAADALDLFVKRLRAIAREGGDQ